MERFEEYLKLLDDAARAPDSIFPEMLFEPMRNDYPDDIYFDLSAKDFKNDAVNYDKRFTTANLNRIRNRVTRIRDYLEYSTLYDDYCDYLISKYSSLEFHASLVEANLSRDPLPRATARPVLRSKKMMAMVENGIIPMEPVRSSMYVAENLRSLYMDEEERIAEITEYELTHYPEPSDNELPIEPLRKGEEAGLKIRMARGRQHDRRDIFASGRSLLNGISGACDFVDNVYSDLSSGIYESKFSTRSDAKRTLVDEIQSVVDDEFLGEEGREIRDARNRILRDDTNNGQRSIFNGSHLVDSRHSMSEEQQEIVKFIIQVQPDSVLKHRIMGGGGGMSGQRRKFFQDGLAEAGVSIPMTKKELKAQRKKREKIERARDQELRGHVHLSETLLSNKIMNTGGMRSFEDMRRRR